MCNGGKGFAFWFIIKARRRRTMQARRAFETALCTLQIDSYVLSFVIDEIFYDFTCNNQSDDRRHKGVAAGNADSFWNDISDHASLFGMTRILRPNDGSLEEYLLDFLS